MQRPPGRPLPPIRQGIPDPNTGKATIINEINDMHHTSKGYLPPPPRHGSFPPAGGYAGNAAPRKPSKYSQ